MRAACLRARLREVGPARFVCKRSRAGTDLSPTHPTSSAVPGSSPAGGSQFEGRDQPGRSIRLARVAEQPTPARPLCGLVRLRPRSAEWPHQTCHHAPSMA